MLYFVNIIQPYASKQNCPPPPTPPKSPQNYPLTVIPSEGQEGSLLVENQHLLLDGGGLACLQGGLLLLGWRLEQLDGVALPLQGRALRLILLLCLLWASLALGNQGFPLH